MQYRTFGQTGMTLSAVGLGGLIAHYWEGADAGPSPDQKQRVYRHAAEAGINLFDTGYGDEAHLPDELKGPGDDRYFALKTGARAPADIQATVEKNLTHLRRDAIDILRVHHNNYTQNQQIPETIDALKQAGKVRALCLIRHFEEDQDAYAAHGPIEGADADLVIYNYVHRTQAPGIERSARAGTGVLAMKALGGQYASWDHKLNTDWTATTERTLMELSPVIAESLENELSFVYAFTAGPWHELTQTPGPTASTTRATAWVLQNQHIDSALIGVASVDELDAVLEAV